MQLKDIKLTISIVWLVAITVASVLTGVTSASGWLLLAATGVLPPLAMLRYWHHPAPTMSEQIQQALR
jgi:hypothetical protein